MKYKVGDKVRVMKDLIAGKSYGNWAFIHEMAPLIGKYVTITKVLEDSYKIEEDISRITDEMLEDVEEEFKLPKKWYIKINTYEEAAVYRAFFSYKTTLKWDYDLGYKYGWNGRSFEAACELGLLITFDQFKKYVLKSEPTPVKGEVKFNTLEQSREALLEEANRRYPVGTKYICVKGIRKDIGSVFELTNEDKLKFYGSGRNIDAYTKGFVYCDGKWAEIVESPKVTEEISPDLSVKLIPPIQSLFLRDGMYVVGVDPVDYESNKNKGEPKSPTNESDFPIISTKRIINFSQLT